MNEEIRTLEKVIEQLKLRVTIAAREPFVLNGYAVLIVSQPSDRSIMVFIDDNYVGGMHVGGSYDAAARLARDIANACYVDREHYATTRDELMYRLDRAKD